MHSLGTAEPQSPADATKKCVECASEIAIEARVCTECNAYQSGLRRHVRISETYLALLIALVSVAGLVAPVLKKVFEKPKTDIRARVVGATSREDGEHMVYTFSIWLANDGERPGLVTRGVRLFPAEGSPSFDGAFPKEIELRPGESTLQEVSIPVKMKRHSQEFVDGTIQLDIVDSDSTAKSIGVERPANETAFDEQD